MPHLQASELILNPDNSVYHLNLLPKDIADTIIFVGDPDRVSVVSKYFDYVDIKKGKREFLTHTGVLGNKRLTVISTGIGADNIDIALTELDALVNIDLRTRTVQPTVKSLNIIRLGTCGALQASIAVDSLVISQYAVGLDGLLSYYDWQPNAHEAALQKQCQKQFSSLPASRVLYATTGSQILIDQFQSLGQTGITLTCEGFYGPQRRYIRAPLIDVDVFALANDIDFENYRVTNMEMETAAIYGLSRLLGHKACSISAVVANRATQTFSRDANRAITHMVTGVLEKI